MRELAREGFMCVSVFVRVLLSCGFRRIFIAHFQFNCDVCIGVFSIGHRSPAWCRWRVDTATATAFRGWWWPPGLCRWPFCVRPDLYMMRFWYSPSPPALHSLEHGVHNYETCTRVASEYPLIALCTLHRRWLCWGLYFLSISFRLILQTKNYNGFGKHIPRSPNTHYRPNSTQDRADMRATQCKTMFSLTCASMHY